MRFTHLADEEIPRCDGRLPVPWAGSLGAAPAPPLKLIERVQHLKERGRWSAYGGRICVLMRWQAQSGASVAELVPPSVICECCRTESRHPLSSTQRNAPGL